MRAQGITIVTGATVEAVEKHGETYRAVLSKAEAVTAERVMFAIGRRANIAGLGLEAAGVALSAVGNEIAVDGYSRSSVAHIYAVGDVTNRVNLTPVAIREGHAVADTLFANTPTPIDHADIATAVFSQPEVGTVGLSEAQACATLANVDIYKATFRPMKATLSGRDTRVLMKLVVDADTDRVMGCHIVGDAAAEIIQAVAIAIKMKATKADFDATMALHPSAAEELVTMREPSARHRSPPA
ncbi:Glutathione reductase [Platysternon megacephalum]|uniref:Glutathione reductase n=1 Tax=Platysternon megacephalum TaxID=55544 RepID=A0A4D9DB32_9SAUR|nr:Glutathione reductase [Platysternon megacephalum]